MKLVLVVALSCYPMYPGKQTGPSVVFYQLTTEKGGEGEKKP